MQHNGDWAYGPLIKACSICSITTRVSAATFPKKSQVSHSSALNKAFNATDSLFNSSVCRAVYCFFLVSASIVSKQLLWRTNKEKIDDCGQWNLKLKLKWGSKTHPQLQIIAIAAAKDDKIKNLCDYNFKASSSKWQLQSCLKKLRNLNFPSSTF